MLPGSTQPCRLGRALTVLLAGCALAACARMGVPTGGPEDLTPPRVESVVPAPDSTGVARTGRLGLTFSEPVRRQEAERLIRLSPAAGRLYFEWQGRAVTIRPSDSLRTDITYRLSLEPGLTDLHKVKADSAFESWFSTGERFSPGRIGGVALYRDSLVLGALITATAADDTSLTFDCRSDSSGRYRLPYLPFGRYRLRAFHDRNRNQRFDYTREESADTLAEVGAEPLGLDLLLSLADTTAPLMIAVSALDSLRLSLAFDDYLDSLQTFAAESFTLCAGDSTGRRLAVQAVSLDSLDHHRLRVHSAEPFVSGERYWVKPAAVRNEAGLTLSPRSGGREFTFKKEETAPPAAAAPPHPPEGRQR